MEAETYLADGYGIRLAIEAKPAGWGYFSEIASASAPPRIKQILVSPENGVPYLNTSQVFDLRPTPWKWLAMEKTTKVEERLVKEGTILVMASATVGRAIVATKAHENTIISHHFMRVTPHRQDMAGWVYAFLRSTQALAMMSGSQYASVIRHIESHHLGNLPIPMVSTAIAAGFQRRVDAIVKCRNDAARLRDEAEVAFASAVGEPQPTEPDHGFTINLSWVRSGRRRLEAAYHTPRVQTIVRNFKRWDRLVDITARVWWPNRFKRVFADHGSPYLSPGDLFTTNAYGIKNVVVEGKKDLDDFTVAPGWLLMARSGQTYGLNGSVTLATEDHMRFFISDDLIRIRPKEGARAGYLLTALTHPTLGRPLLIREAYGMSIPHLDPEDVGNFPVVRLDKATEDRIADLAEQACAEQARAEVLERELAEAAGNVISEFLMRPSLEVVTEEDVADAEVARERMAEIQEHPERVLRGPALEAQLTEWES
jgi:hypothetical protein